MGAYVCPCRVCDNCGNVDNDPDLWHPEDGLAGCSRRGCYHVEWWAVSGPHMDGRHMTSPAEEAAWRAHDEAVWRAGQES